jgi:hypothetical protein
VTVTGDVTTTSGGPPETVQAFATLWAAEDRTVATGTDRTGPLEDGATRGFEAIHRVSAHSGHLLPVVTEQNEVAVPYVTGPTAFALQEG